MRNNKEKKLLLILLVVLIVLVVLPNSLAIFKSSSDGNVVIRASIWDVSLNQNGISNTLNLVSGVVDSEYIVKVDSSSEVDVVYSILISNIPTGVQVKLDSGSFQTPTSGSVTFSDAGTILTSSASHENTHTLTFSSGIGTTEVSNQTINIDVIAKQDLS